MVTDIRELNDVTNLLLKTQQDEYDMREACRESDHFVNKRDGQWEPSVTSKMTNRPRYTFDKVSPIVDQISGELSQADFAVRCKPAGSAATDSLAKLRDGMFRNIQNISKASDIYMDCAQRTLECGLSGWRVDHDWVDDDSFFQDLFIREIPNFIDRVWLDPAHEKADGSDAKWGFILNPMTRDDYWDTYPNGSGQGVPDSLTANVYWYKPDHIIIAEFWHARYVRSELLLLSNNKIVENDEKFQMIEDELKKMGVTVKDRRMRKKCRFWVRKFDGQRWLTQDKESVFSSIPIVPLYGNFKISENKRIYRSLVEKLIDPQRVYNYARSRQIEEGALAPRAKYWMTKEQAGDYLSKLTTLNTNADPVQFYVHVDGQPAPAQIGGAQINAGLQQTAQDANEDIKQTAGLYSANMGEDPRYMQTGAAIERLQNKGDNPTYKWFRMVEKAIARTGDIIVKAIPHVYSAERMVRIVGQDGVGEDVIVNQTVKDEQTGTIVMINDLSQGKYDVVCSAGPAFQNRQDQVVKTITSLAQVDKSILDIGADVLLKNMNTPGMDEIAARKRIQMLLANLIPKSQQTEQEKKALEMIEKAKANQPPSPMDQALIAQAKAETDKASAAALKAETAASQMLSSIQHNDAKLMLEREKFKEAQKQNARDFEVKMATLAAKLEDNQFKHQQETAKMVLDAQNSIFAQLKAQAETLNLLRSAMGADAIIAKPVVEAYITQAEALEENLETESEM